VKLFGGESKKFRVVPRSATDTTPLDPAIAEALRKAGKDPSRFTVAPFEQGEAESPRRLSMIERLVDEAAAARITKDKDGWLVSFDAPDEAGVAGAAQHERFVSATAPFGAEDRGFAYLTMNVNRMMK
jgi:hypothetical protein